VEIVFTAQEILVGHSDYPTTKIAENARSHRQLGLGYANLGALLMQRGLPYDSNQGRAYAAAVTALMTGAAYSQSGRIAEAVGPYEAGRASPSTGASPRRYGALGTATPSPAPSPPTSSSTAPSKVPPASRTRISRSSTARSSRRTASARSTTWATSRCWVRSSHSSPVRSRRP